MTAAEFKNARKSLGLTQCQIAPFLGFSSKVRVSEVERGVRNVSASVSLLIQAYMAGYRPNDWPE